MPGGQLSAAIRPTKLELGYGILIIRIGDYDGSSPLDPLAKSLLHYCRVILPGDDTRLIELRTLEELDMLWKRDHAAYHQVVLVSHGDKDCIVFGDKDVSAADLAKVLDAHTTTPKEFIGLGCNTGHANFAREFSRSASVSRFIASYHTVNSCTASLFAQTYFHERLIAVHTPNVSFKNARTALYSAASYRQWIDGALSI
jgi:hypothetical protein